MLVSRKEGLSFLVLLFCCSGVQTKEKLLVSSGAEHQNKTAAPILFKKTKRNRYQNLFVLPLLFYLSSFLRLRFSSLLLSSLLLSSLLFSSLVFFSLLLSSLLFSSLVFSSLLFSSLLFSSLNKTNKTTTNAASVLVELCSCGYCGSNSRHHRKYKKLVRRKQH